ncbi:HEAT repeat domain-containing protein [Candidatus Poribacteria bacterium]|nr:HEAT repeat domain-containing protein [Candidatus Poribacteria bacterium]
MLTRELIDKKKSEQSVEFFARALVPTSDEQTLLFVLQNLGRLPRDFDGNVFLPLLGHPNPEIRLHAVKNIGKLKDGSLLGVVSEFAYNEDNTLTRREAVSTIGRMRTEKAIPVLLTFLDDEDPKVILQAIRALLYFKELPEVKSALSALADHPNELIQDVIRRERAQHPAALQRMGKSRDETHPQSPNALKNVMVQGDVRETLTYVPDESVHLTFTSPPYYNARDYTIYKSYEGYLEFLVGIFEEVHRITKEGRFFVLNTSPVIIPRMSRAHASKRYAIPFDIHPRLTQMGWEFIEDIIWVKPDQCAKNRNGGFFQHRKPLGYKANSVSEYVMVYRKKTDKLIDWNMRQYHNAIIEASQVNGDYEKTNVWKINPANDKVHPAIFPLELAARVIQFYSFKGDLVFDPFGGIGTVGQAALSLGRFFFLVEQEQQYVQRAMRMLDALSCEIKPTWVSLRGIESADPSK